MAYFDKYGAEYSDDRRQLLNLPKDFRGVYEVSNTVKWLDLYAFAGCSRLTTIIIPSSVEYVEMEGDNCDIFPHDGLLGCENLSCFYVDSNNAKYCSIDGVLFNKTKDTLIYYPPAKKGTLVLTSNIMEIDDVALESINEDVEFKVENSNPNFYVLNGCLYNKANNDLIRCPRGFCGIMRIPDGVQSVNFSAFANCRGITKIYFPKSFKSFNIRSISNLSWQMPEGAYPFRGCDNLSEFVVDDENDAYFTDENGILCGGEKYYDLYDNLKWDDIQLLAYPIGKKEKNCTITLLIENIVHSAFWGSNLESLRFLSDIEYIDDYAFRHVQKLKHIEFYGVKHIGEHAFYECQSLHSIKLPFNLIDISANAFEDSGISQVIIPEVLELYCKNIFKEQEFKINVEYQLEKQESDIVKYLLIHQNIVTSNDVEKFHIKDLKKVVDYLRKEGWCIYPHHDFSDIDKKQYSYSLSEE